MVTCTVVVRLVSAVGLENQIMRGAIFKWLASVVGYMNAEAKVFIFNFLKKKKVFIYIFFYRTQCIVYTESSLCT